MTLYAPLRHLTALVSSLLFGLTLITRPAFAQTRAYVLDSCSHNVSAIDTATNTVIATIPVGLNPYSLVITQDGTRVYVTNQNDLTISVIDTATNTVIDSIPTTDFNDFLNGIAVSPDGRRLYVVDDNGNRNVFVIDPASHALVASILGDLPPRN